MKVGYSDRHLTYCSNIHAGEAWPDVLNNLKHYVPPLKAKLAPDAAFGIGLRLADGASQALLQGQTLGEFAAWLQAEDLYVFTLNGFPYGSFHHKVVKDNAYAPDWTTPERLAYTLRLIEILAYLLPPGLEGGISTLPLSYKPWWFEQPAALMSALSTSVHHLAQVTARLVQLAQDTGKVLHLDIEPEPDCLLENTAEVIDFFRNWLLPLGGQWLQRALGVSQAVAEAHLLKHIRICYDTCHFAVEYEDPAAVFRQLQAAGIRIGKIQVSAAIQVAIPAEMGDRHRVSHRLLPFAESTYLHQVIERHGDGTLHRYRDLAEALPALETTDGVEWRTHFHVPIFIQDYQTFTSTQGEIIRAFEALSQAGDADCHHLEIETYTWEVLPPEMKSDLLSSIEREYRWVLSTLARVQSPPLTPSL